MEKKIQLAKALVKRYFKEDDGKTPLELSYSQAKIFCTIFFKDNPRVEIIAPTQYGKSMTVSVALILRSQFFKEHWAIVTGEQKKSEIIMGSVISHLFDNPKLVSQLEIDTKQPLDRIKRERSKKRLTWKQGGSITAITAEARNRKRVKESLSGLGCPNIVEDEAALIPDDLQAMLLRMLGGHRGGTLIKIGNPYNRNHFLKTSLDPRYHQIFIDYHTALKEERYTPEFVEEMRTEAFFEVLYECKFPPDNELDMEGFRRLLTDGEIINSQNKVEHKGELRMGFDVGEGGDSNVGVLRSDTYGEIVHRSKTKDLMATVGVIVKLIKDYGLEHENVFVDKIGIGAGVVSRLQEMGFEVVGINWANKSENETFTNLKAENYWKNRIWIKEGGCLSIDKGWNELIDIKYKEDSSGRVKIKSKEDMRKEGIPSPNDADALALTFNKGLDEDAPSIRML